MNGIQNFLLLSRVNTSSTAEKCADLLLTPARILFGGKCIINLPSSMHIANQRVGLTDSPPWIKSALKVIAFFTLPIALLGVLIKLICLRDGSYRAFCAHEVPANSICHPKLFEMCQHVHMTRDFAKEDSRDFGSTVVFKPLDLSECCCPGTQAFHRLHSSRRDNLENAIVQRLNETKPDKNQPLHLLSMGSGGLMSDFLTLEKLILAGFNNISIDCVDPIGIDLARVERIRRFFVDYPEVSIQIQAYRNIEEVPVEETGYSALLAIDYDALSSFDFDNQMGCTGDLMKAYLRLSADGFMGLGFSDEDTLSGPQMDPVVVTSNPSKICNLVNDLAQQLPQKDELTVTIPNFRFAGASHVLLLCLSLAIKKSAKVYQNISLSCFNETVCRNEEPQYRAMMEALFPEAVIEISFHEEQNKKCDLLFTGSLEEEFTSGEYLSLLQSEALTYILFNGGGIFRQNNDQEDQRVQII